MYIYWIYIHSVTSPYVTHDINNDVFVAVIYWLLLVIWIVDSQRDGSS